MRLRSMVTDQSIREGTARPDSPILSIRKWRRILASGMITVVTAFSGTAHADKTDRDKPVNIESDRMSADDAKKTAVFDGKVVLTQGTLTIRADKITVRQDAEGFQFGIATGNLATFRQKREGFNEYIEGEAERIEYDSRADRVELFTRARMRRDGGDDVNGNYISYDSRTEFFTVLAAKDAPRGAPESRVRAVIMPKKKPDSTTGATPESRSVPSAGNLRQN